jgi:6-phosphofructokinase 2
MFRKLLDPQHEPLRAPTVTIRSKVGAGDSMVGGILRALAHDYSPREAARFGVAAGQPP